MNDTIHDEKIGRKCDFTEHAELLPQTYPRSMPPRSRIITRLLPAILFTFAFLVFLRNVFFCQHHPGLRTGLPDLVQSNMHKSKRIPLEAHIMSKCPDARDCLRQLVVPTMEEVSDKVDFKLSYIGKIDPESDDVYCMHGPSECLGNIIQLCAAKLYPDPKLYLGFATCMTSNYTDIPDRDLVEECALEHGIDFQKVNSCISDEGHGNELLRSSIKRSQNHNVTKSCTIRLNGKIRCIRDGGEWYDCSGGSEVSDLVRDINKLYDSD